jgi:hypothetical protein
MKLLPVFMLLSGSQSVRGERRRQWWRTLAGTPWARFSVSLKHPAHVRLVGETGAQRNRFQWQGQGCQQAGCALEAACFDEFLLLRRASCVAH